MMARHPAWIAAIFLCLLAEPAGALKISPFKTSLEADSANPTEVFRVENNAGESAAVEISVTTWSIATDGSESNASAESDFIVFPAQMVLKPHESRAVRVQYVGVAPQREKAYRVVAEQLPISLRDTPDAGSYVKFMLKFRAALYITPKGAAPGVRVVSATSQSGGLLRLELVNEGAVHAVMQKSRLDVVFDGGRSLSLDAGSLKGLEGENMHAGATRVFLLPLPAGHAAGKVVDATLTFETAF